MAILIDEEKVELNVDMLMQLLNGIIYTAIEHGGDWGGAYCSKTEELRAKMQSFIEWAGINEYFVCEDECGYLFYKKNK